MTEWQRARLWIPTALVCLSTPVLPAADPPLGFSAATVAGQVAAEEVFLQTPTPNKARRWLAQLTEEPHVAGTAQERRVAEYVHERLEELGLETETVTYDVFLNHPREVSLRLVAPEEMELSLREEPYDQDKDSTSRGLFPGFHGYGASGRAEGQVVYVNYGTAADFKRLEEMGIDPAGRVVLVRYGQVFRGLKVREAEARGAAGVLIYSDPGDDGYMRGDVYPDGPMRPASAIQRGSVQFLSLGPGDPSTPGYPSTDDATRVPRTQMKTVPHIPSLPLSYGEAEKILRRLGGARVPDDWQGGLPFAYHVGPGGAAVEMKVEMDEGLKPIYNVFARIPGREEPEGVVILGNHRDAWNHGAVDPNSGTAAMLETARGLAAAVKAGWRPRRTLVLASWDAEEYGLVGSTEWGEDRADELRDGAVAYVNLDSAVTGRDLRVGGSPSLRDLFLEVASELHDPMSGETLAAGWEKRQRRAWANDAPVELSVPDPPFEPFLSPLGSGSDYTVFLDHLGIASFNFGFSGPYGVYHSAYDNFRWMDEFGDPGFVYHATAARFYGLLAMRLTSAQVVPLRFSSYASALRRHLDDLRRDARRKKRQASQDENGNEGPLDPDWTPVLAALDRLDVAGKAADRAVDDLLTRTAQVGAGLSRLNQALSQVERSFLSPDGLPGRPWFRHLLFAPGTTTGYASWPFPGLTQAVADADASLFDDQMKKVTAALAAAAEALDEAAEMARRLP